MEIAFVANNAGLSSPETLAGRKLCRRNPVQDELRPNRVWFEPASYVFKRKGAVQTAGLRAAVRSEMAVQEKSGSLTRKNNPRPVGLFVGLPLDTVSECNSLNHSKGIAVGLRALKLLGIHGIELPISWGIVFDGNWSSYLAVAEMACEIGLNIHVSLHIHCDRDYRLSMPKCVSNAVKNDPDLLFTDRSGLRKADCLSFAVDELAVIDGRKPVELYEKFFKSFRSAFAHHIGTTIKNITIGLGPNGELRYPSFPQSTRGNRFTGVGEFQCYDKYMLADLKRHAEESGNPFWGLSGPHDAPEYNQSPDFGFFKENGGSWETPYGRFFLSWYSEKLLSHADCLLSIGSKVFGDLPVTLSSKVPLLPCWHNTRSRPAQLTAGFYNTIDRDGYDALAKIFAKNSCAMIISGMDLSDGEQPQSVHSSPQSLLSQIRKACEQNGVKVYGANSWLVTSKSTGFSRIKENILSGVDLFTYHRMGAEFFSPDHWSLFTEFIRSLAQMEIDTDDLPNDDEKMSCKMRSEQGNDREMQAV